MSENQLSKSLSHEDARVWLQRSGWMHRGRHVHCVMEIGLITVKSYGGVAKRLQLRLQCNMITMDGDGKAI